MSHSFDRPPSRPLASSAPRLAAPPCRPARPEVAARPPCADNPPRPPLLYWPAVAGAAGLALLFVGGLIVLTWTSSHRAPAAGPHLAVRLPEVTDPAPEAGAGAPTTIPGDAEPVHAAPPGAPTLGLPPLPPLPMLPVEPKTAPTPAQKPETTPESAPTPPAAPAPAAAAPHQKSTPRRQLLGAEELSKQLRGVPELNLERVPGATNQLLALAHKQSDDLPHAIPTLLVDRSDFKGLPLRKGFECQLGKESSDNLQVLSRKLRTHLTGAVPQDGIDIRPNARLLRQKLLESAESERDDWRQPEAIPTLVQLLQAEDKPLRLLLVELLAQIKGRAASAALAQRALFDLSDEVRDAAVAALKERPRAEYRSLLLNGFRYPWPPAADHAAEALATLQDGATLAKLVDLLDLADPRLPAVPDASPAEGRVPMVRELVRVNHFANCLLCHAPSLETTDPVRGLVPTPGQPLPPAFTPQYYEGNRGIFVRADITYLKQDFSVPQPVAKPGAWPANQRFDYLVRTRPARPGEVALVREAPVDYPQRDAVLFALRQLTGEDRGPSSTAWRQMLASRPPPGRMETEP